LVCVPELPELPAGALLPGAFTLVVPNPGRRYQWLNAGETIGVRVPTLDGPARDVLAQVGAVAATSANRHGGPDPRRLEDVPREIRGGCARGSESRGVAASTVS